MGQSSSNPLIPTGYKELKRLGAGSYGVVVKCLKKDTKEIVALKIPQRGNLDNELAVMTFFERNNLDTCNIVRFIEPVTLLDNRTALAYESLDVTLSDYVNATACTGLNAHEVRSIVQQLASALNALESIKVIHADITFNNIMLVDRKAQPLRVKLIDFGLALPSSLVKQGLRRQVKTYRAPEVFLGLPFSESIDMWSLGVVMARLVLDRMIFPGITDYDVLQHIVDFLGVPSDHLLTAGMYSNRYFVKEHSSKWRLMTYEEFWGPMQVLDNGRVPRINYPDCLETSPMEQLNVVEAAEKEECIDLMKAMLRMDSNERITPSQVLAHPFIRRGNLHHRSDSIREASAPPPQTPSVSTSLEYKSWSGSDSECHKPAAAQIPPGVILVQPAPPECRVALAEDNRQSETFHSICEASAPPPQTPSVSTSLEYKSWSGSDSECHESDSVEIPPGVILVQPAPPECCLALAEDNRQSEGARSIREVSAPPPQTPSVSTSLEYKSWSGSDSECHESDSVEIPPGVILVQPAPPECCLALAEDSRQSEGARSIREVSAPPPQTPSVSTSLEYKSWSGSDSECHKPAAAQIPPGVILVQPAPPECRVALAEDNRQSETSRPLDLLEELSESSSVELPAHLAEGSDVQQEDTESTNITPVPQKRKKRTKKNPFKRLWDWAKETFTSRNSVDSES